MDLVPAIVMCFVYYVSTTRDCAEANAIGETLHGLGQDGEYAQLLGMMTGQGRTMTDTTTEKPKPCHVDRSFLFAMEDASVGSVVLTIPTSHGEEWTLTETGPQGYLTVVAGDEKSEVVFTKSPDVETMSKAPGRRKETLPFVLICSYREWVYRFNQELILRDVNEHAPVFDMGRSYNISMSEASHIGSHVFSLRHVAYDPDVTGRVANYSLHAVNGSSEIDGRTYFRISKDNSHVVLHHPIDFDEMNGRGQTYIILNITATDDGDPTPLSSHTLLTIHITDADDQGPAFSYPHCPQVGGHCVIPYFQTVMKCGYKGPLLLYPGPIVAEDLDTMNYSISYNLTAVEPEEYTDNFKLDETTGKLTVMKRSCDARVNEILLTIQATENSPLKHSVSANVQIDLLDNPLVPNLAWSAVANRQGLPGDQKMESPSSPKASANTALSLTLFLLSIIGFVGIGSVLALIAFRIAKTKTMPGPRPPARATDMFSGLDCTDCTCFQKDAVTGVTSFSSCSSPSRSESRSSCCGGSGGLSTYIPCSGEVGTDDEISVSHEFSDTRIFTSDGGLPDHHHPAVANGGVVNGRVNTLPREPQRIKPMEYDDNFQFRIPPVAPGRADVSSFLDITNRAGSMKHDRSVTSNINSNISNNISGNKGNLRYDHQFKNRINNFVPEFLKTKDNPRVRFDVSSLTPI